jgi:cytochrome b subunit of formate dehydrogenase
MPRKANKRTDFGTVLLHWAAVLVLLTAALTGLRITANAPGYEWLHGLPVFLPAKVTWSWHMLSGVALFGLSLAYIAYMARSGLARRIWPDKTRLLGVFGRKQARLGALNVLLCWCSFSLIGLLLFTGICMYLGRGGILVELHRFATWGILAFPLAHIAVHFAIGGVPQLLRIFRPAGLTPPPPPFDPFEVLALPPAEARKHIISGGQSAILRRSGVAPTPRQRPAGVVEEWRRRETMLQAHPLAVALAAGFTGAVFLLSADEFSRDTLHIARISPQNAPVLDGDVADAAWRNAKPTYVETQQGHNFEGSGATTIQVRAVHDGRMAYFAFVWDDPTRSLKHLPLYKKEDGWHVVENGFEREDEDSYANDAFSMALTTTDSPNIRYPGGHSFHIGVRPIADKPASFAGRGLHFTDSDRINDVWYWRASQGGMAGPNGLPGWCEDAEIGPPMEATQEQVQGKTRYYGGLAFDAGKAISELNFEQRPPDVGYGPAVQPKRLPRNPSKVKAAMGQVSLDSERSESDGSTWWLTPDESAPYSPALDAQFPVGSIIPGVLIVGEPAGDRADVRCAARWAAGRWTLEASRQLDTRSEHDVIIGNQTAFRLAGFDHSQIAHTRQIRVIGMELE